MSENKLGTIGLIHGYGHRAAHWDKFRPELEAQGFDSIAVDLPADNPSATFADYARVAADAFEPAIKDGRRIDLILHSMGSNVLPDLVEIIGVAPIRNVFHVSGSIGEPDGGGASSLTTIMPRIPKQRNTPEYRDATLRLQEEGMTVLNPAQIRRLLFSDCTPEEFIWALELMRLQGKPKAEPPLEAFKIPGLRQTYLLGDADPIRNTDYVLDKMVGELGMKLVMMRGGHSPAISRPRELAEVVAGEVRSNLLLEDTGVLQVPPNYRYNPPPQSGYRY